MENERQKLLKHDLSFLSKHVVQLHHSLLGFLQCSIVVNLRQPRWLNLGEGPMLGCPAHLQPVKEGAPSAMAARFLFQKQMT